MCSTPSSSQQNCSSQESVSLTSSASLETAAESKEVRYALLPLGYSHGSYSNHWCSDIYTGKSLEGNLRDCSFTSEHHTIVEAYRKEKGTQGLHAFDERARALYERAIAPLAIGEYTSKRRDVSFEDLGKMMLLTAVWPVIMPYLVVRNIVAPEKGPANSDGELGFFLAPLALPMLIKEALFSSETHTYTSKKVTKKAQLMKGTDGVHPALGFWDDDTPKRFSSMDLIFPDGTLLSDSPDGAIHGAWWQQKERYADAKWSLRMDTSLREEILALGKEKQEYIDKHEAFREDLRSADHVSLLERCGFLP